MQVQFNTIQSNYHPQFQALTKFNHTEIKNGLKVTKWVDGIIGAEEGLRALADDVNIEVSIKPNDKCLDMRFIELTISEIGRGKRQVSESFCPYIRDEANFTTKDFTSNFLCKVSEYIEKFKAVAKLEEY